MNLRPYQQDAVTALGDYWAHGTRPLIVAPTGSGKSIVIAEFIRTAILTAPHMRILVAVHTRELVQQDHDTLARLCPDVSMGIYSAGLQRRDTRAQVTFANIQSVYNKAHLWGRVDVLIIDEAHRIPTKSDTQYRTLISDLTERNPRLAIIGLTATPYRLDSGLLHEGDDALFDGIAHVTPVPTLVDAGHLVPLVSRGGVAAINTSGVRIQRGEFAQRELQEAAMPVTEGAVQEVIAYGQHREAWLLFATGVDHAQHITDLLRSHGIDAEMVIGSTPSRQRDGIIRRFRDGKLKALVNVGVLTTGFDAPRTDLIALLTATKSASKYVQILGRGMRPSPDKTDCLILDYGGNVERFGPVEAVNPLTKGADGRQRMPYKTCPSCRAHLPSGVRTCPACQHTFPRPDPDLYPEASALRPYGGITEHNSAWVQVDDTLVTRHQKLGAPDSVRLTFLTEIGKVHKWLPLEHSNPHARRFAHRYISQAGGDARSVDTAIEQSPSWNVPSHILLRRNERNPKYYDITDYRFDDGKCDISYNTYPLSTTER